MDMSEKEINRIVSNDKEWRKHIFHEMRDIRKDQKEQSEKQQEIALEMNTLKVKVAFFGGISGTVFGAITAWVMSRI